jgi:hypothetical protein
LDYIKEAEKYLYNYRELRGSLNSMRSEIARLVARGGPRELTALSVDSVGAGGGSGAYDETANMLFRIGTLKQNIAETKEKLREIDIILDEISQGEGQELYGKILRAWYVEKMPKEFIAEEMGCGIQWVYELRGRAIRKFAVRVLGIGALRGM